VTTLGLLPSIRGGLGELARTGQHTRLIDGYLRPYARAFDEVRYFSYLVESLEAYTDDAELRRRVRLFPGASWHPWAYAFALPFRYRHALGSCDVLRVFQVTGVIPALVARRLFGVPFVTTYGFWYGRLARSRVSGFLSRLVTSAGLAAASAVIVTTPELGDEVRARHPRARIELVPNGVDTTAFRPPAPRPGGARLLYAGRLSEEKQLDTLLDAAAKLAARHDVRVTLVGDGPARAALAAQARAGGLDVTFRPFVDHRQLPGVLGESDVFVLPSRTEGHPKILLEAMACGRPCVASAVGGNRAIVADGETGLLFPPGDAGALADRVERLLRDQQLAASLGARARAEIAARYDLGILVAREIALLRAVAAGR
jgi:glycosyltransferase involved in cell wall biosynthesis